MQAQILGRLLCNMNTVFLLCNHCDEREAATVITFQSCKTLSVSITNLQLDFLDHVSLALLHRLLNITATTTLLYVAFFIYSEQIQQCHHTAPLCDFR